MPTTRVLFLTDRSKWHQQRALQYAPADLEVIIRRRPAAAELTALLPEVEFIISERSESVTADMIHAAPKLKLIVRLGSLLHGIDVQAARLANVRLSMQPVLGSVYCAEHALMLILAVIKKLRRSLDDALRADHGMEAHRTDENTFAFNWLNYPDIDGLINMSVAILGMGEIGVELTRRLIGFRPTHIYYHKRTPYAPETERELRLTYATADHCARACDVLVSLLPYSPETDLSLNAAFLSQMKPSALLVHLGSGSVIDERALIAALSAGKLRGAGLDTYEFEPLAPDHPLVVYARDPRTNLILTPHTAAASLPPDRSGDYGEIMRLLKGEPLRFEV
jgi:lactate dehydrogenase-like 2-hydroxyacid dehydrogenase